MYRQFIRLAQVFPESLGLLISTSRRAAAGTLTGFKNLAFARIRIDVLIDRLGHLRPIRGIDSHLVQCEGNDSRPIDSSALELVENRRNGSRNLLVGKREFREFIRELLARSTRVDGAVIIAGEVVRESLDIHVRILLSFC